MNNNEFTNYLNGTQTARDAWDKKVSSTADHTFGGLTMIWRMLNKVCIVAKQRRDDQIKDTVNTYAANVAAEKTAAIRAEYVEFLNENKRRFVEWVNRVADEKTAEVDKVLSKTGDPDLISLIQGLSVRNEVGDREWQSIIQRVNGANDYQASRMLADIASKFGRSFKPPFDADKIIDSIEKSREEFLHMASVMDAPQESLGYYELMTVGEYEHLTPFQERYDTLDHSLGTTVPIKKMNLIDALQDALKTAEENKDNNTANAIRRFLYDNVQYVEDRKVVSEFLRGEAEALIARAKASAERG